jgi:hypothetical protein
MIDIDLILQKRPRFQIPDRKKSRKKEKEKKRKKERKKERRKSRKKEKEKESDTKKIRADNCQPGF